MSLQKLVEQDCENRLRNILQQGKSQQVRQREKEERGNVKNGTLYQGRVRSNLVCPTLLTFFRSLSGSSDRDISALFTCLVRPECACS